MTWFTWAIGYFAIAIPLAILVGKYMKRNLH